MISMLVSTSGMGVVGLLVGLGEVTEVFRREEHMYVRGNTYVKVRVTGRVVGRPRVGLYVVF